MATQQHEVSFRYSLPTNWYKDSGNRTVPMQSSSQYNQWSETPSWVSSDHNNRSQENRVAGDWAGLQELDWTHETLVAFKKSFYREHPQVATRTEAEVRTYRDTSHVTVTGTGMPKQILTFEEASFPEYITKSRFRSGFTTPTPIQGQGWPVALIGHDMIGIAQAGSGMILAYLLPVLVHINDQPRLMLSFTQKGVGPMALVLAPTRELAKQTAEERFGCITDITNTYIYGGASHQYQQRDLERGAHIIIATPGRLLDFLDSRVTNLKRVTYLVLNEAERMLDMGFEPQMRKVLSQIRPARQTLMWSATWQREVQTLARDFMANPLLMQVGSLNLAVNVNIDQKVEFVDVDRILTDVLKSRKGKVFAETKRNCEMLSRELRERRMPMEALHGDKIQRERHRIIIALRNSDYQVLVATYVASRGMDLKDIEYVIGFDFPSKIEDYMHRISRTGRAGVKGTAMTFFSHKDSRSAKDLLKIKKETKQVIPQALQDLASRPTNATIAGSLTPGAAVQNSEGRSISITSPSHIPAYLATKRSPACRRAGTWPWKRQTR